MATTQLLLTPIIYIPIQASLTASLIALTSPTSFLWPLLLPILAICNYCLLSTYSYYIPRPSWIGFVSGATLGGLLDYVEKLLLVNGAMHLTGLVRRLSPQRRQRTRNGTAERHQADRAAEKEAYGIPSDSESGPPCQAATSPLPIQRAKSLPTRIPTLLSFPLARIRLEKASNFGHCEVAMDLLAQGNQLDKNPTVYAESRLPIFTWLHDVTVDEVITRTRTSVFYWVAAYIVWLPDRAIETAPSGINSCKDSQNPPATSHFASSVSPDPLPPTGIF